MAEFTEREIFLKAVSLAEAERVEFVKKTCGGNRLLCDRVLAELDKATSAGVISEEDNKDVSEIASIQTVPPNAEHPSPADASSSVRSRALFPGQTIGPYTLLKRIGEGGMGEVWLAEQHKPVKRQIALKVIKSGINCQSTLLRFEVERQALALMSHPNIARILDAGATPDGQPYFAMELVSGVPLTEYCDKNCLGIDDRLKLFVDVCQGVQHAHQKGVIHRDLKPGNILVEAVDGKPTVKVIDFGLAKALDTTESLSEESLFTVVGQILGTLKYMSPEQASLDSADIDTRADVYALGVILHELLTGFTPLDGFGGEKAVLKILDLIRESEPVRPSLRLNETTDEEIASITRNRKISSSSLYRVLAGDLDWIVMKALDKDRSRRYDSASGLAEDIQRFLQNEPVVARPPTFGYQISKFVRKNQTAVIGAGLFSLALVVGLLGTTWGFYEASQSAVAERSAKLDAQQRESEAIEQRKRAEASEQEAIDAVEKFGSIVAENLELRNNTGLRELRNTLLSEPIRFFKNLRQQMVSDGQPRPESLKRLAAVAFSLGELTTEIGDQEDALDSFQQSLRIRNELLQLNPESVDAMLQHGNSLLAVGALKRELGMLDEARELADHAIELLQRAEKMSSGSQAVRSNLASSLNLRAVIFNQLGDPAQAIDAHREAVELQLAMIAKQPNNIEFQRDLAGSYSNLGLCQKTLGKNELALDSYQNALRIRLRLANANPGSKDLRADVGMSHNNIGVLFKGLGKPAEALESYEASLRIRKQLATDYPTVSRFHHFVAQSLQNIAVVARETGKVQESIEAFREATAIYKKLCEENPTVLDYQSELAQSHCNTGVTLNEFGKASEGLEALKTGRQIQEELVEQYPDAAECKIKLALSHEAIGKLLAEKGETSQALVAYREALELREKLSEEEPDSVQHQNGMATIHNLLGNLLLATGDKKNAVHYLRQAVAIQSKVAKEHPLVEEYQKVLALSFNNLGSALSNLSERQESIRMYRQASELLKGMLKSNPKSIDLINHLGVILHNIATQEIDTGDYSTAEKLLLRAADYQREAIRINPRNLIYRQHLSMHLRTRLQALAELVGPVQYRDARKDLANAILDDPRSATIQRMIAKIQSSDEKVGPKQILGLANFANESMDFLVATELLERLLSENPAMNAERRAQLGYNAACNAVLAAAGESLQQSDFDAPELRQKALEWLSEAIGFWQQLATKDPQQISVIQTTLKHWKRDLDLASVREAECLTKLSKGQRIGWEEFWMQVDELLSLEKVCR